MSKIRNETSRLLRDRVAISGHFLSSRITDFLMVRYLLE